MKDYCPACAMEVEYEGTGHNASCNICGRTKSAAEQTVRSRTEQCTTAILMRIALRITLIARRWLPRYVPFADGGQLWQDSGNVEA